MMGRLFRMLRRMTDDPATSSWRPRGYDPMVALPMIEALATDVAPEPHDGSGSELRDRQRELAFDMYAEALVRIADEDDAAHRRATDADRASA